jgi:hypothetical protein
VGLRWLVAARVDPDHLLAALPDRQSSLLTERGDGASRGWTASLPRRASRRCRSARPTSTSSSPRRNMSRNSRPTQPSRAEK